MPHFWPPGFCSARVKQAALPNIAKILNAWLSPNQRARAQGIVWLCSRWAGAFASNSGVLIDSCRFMALCFPGVCSRGFGLGVVLPNVVSRSV